MVVEVRHTMSNGFLLRASRFSFHAGLAFFFLNLVTAGRQTFVEMRLTSCSHPYISSRKSFRRAVAIYRYFCHRWRKMQFSFQYHRKQEMARHSESLTQRRAAVDDTIILLSHDESKESKHASKSKVFPATLLCVVLIMLFVATAPPRVSSSSSYDDSHDIIVRPLPPEDKQQPLAGTSLSKETFEAFVERHDIAFIVYYSEKDHDLFRPHWNDFCQKIKYTRIKSLSNNSNQGGGDDSSQSRTTTAIPPVYTGTVNCDEHVDLCRSHRMQFLRKIPRMVLYQHGSVKQNYGGDHSVGALMGFIRGKLSTVRYFSPIYLGADTFHDFIAKMKFVFVNFLAPRDTLVQRMAPVWEQFANQTHFDKSLPVMVSSVDCTMHRALCRKFDISSFPTLKWFQNGNAINYRMERSLSAFDAFSRTQVQLYWSQAQPPA